MSKLELIPIGAVENGGIRLAPQYRNGLLELAGFSHIMVLYWFHHLDSPQARQFLVHDKPYRNGPDKIGVFATRGPARPNPIAVSCAGLVKLDAEQGLIHLDYLDAEPGSPVLDIKPYTPSADRCISAAVPPWCAHWPKNLESSGDFDWGAEFNFEK